MGLFWVYAEKDAASDDAVTVVSLAASDGDQVSTGQVICELEGSKSTFEQIAPVSGYVFVYVEEGLSVPIGQAIFCISDEGSEKPPAPKFVGPESQKEQHSERFSKKALDALLSMGKNPDEFRPELDFVTLRDVLPEADGPSKTSKKSVFERIAILGGSFGATLAYEVIGCDPSKVAVGVFDDSENKLEACGVPLLGQLDKSIVQDQFGRGIFDSVFISIQANSSLREDLANWTKRNGIPLATLLHPRALISRNAEIEEGALVMEGARVATLARLGRNVFLSGMVNIDHHCEIGANCTFGPGVFVSGGAVIGSGCSFSSGIVVEPHCQIGERVFVSSGAVIRTEISDDAVVKVKGNTQSND